MKKNYLKTFLLVLGVVGISAGSSYLTQRFLSKQNNSITSTATVPSNAVSYAKFASLPVGANETDFTVAAELSVNAVVHVKTTYEARQQAYPTDIFDFFFGRPQYQQREMPKQQGFGSGVILTEDGYIVTNNHVIDNSDEIEVVLNDKRTFKAKLIGTDPSTDIALLKIEAQGLPTIRLGNSDDLKVGEWVLAVGNPFNLTSTVTAGIVSAKARNINILSNEMKIESFIQTDAAVNPGNSGGALVNTRGELVGINTAIASQTGSYAGYSFAVPTSIVSKVVEDLKQYGVVQRAVLGVQISDISDEWAKEKGLKTLDGAYVHKVMDMSSAALAGIKEGDVIVAVNDVAVKSVSELQEQIGRYRPGDKVSVKIVRNNDYKTLTIELKNQQGTTDVVKNTSSIEVLGATFNTVDEKTARKLGISHGLQVKSISKGKMQEAGIRNDFIILKVNNQIIRSEEDLLDVFKSASQGGSHEKVLFIAGAYPNGKVAYYAINLSE